MEYLDRGAARSQWSFAPCSPAHLARAPQREVAAGAPRLSGENASTRRQTRVVEARDTLEPRDPGAGFELTSNWPGFALIALAPCYCWQGSSPSDGPDH